MRAASIILHRQDQIVRRFREAGVTDRTAARSLSELGMRSHWILRHMARKRVFVSVHPDRWFLDLEALAAFERRQWRRFVIFIGVGAAAFILLLLFR
jgi:hypothetical protein